MINKIDKKTRRVEVVFATEQLVRQKYPFGTVLEALEMTSSSGDLSRINGGGALLLHRNVAKQVGVVEKAWFANRQAHAVIRFSRIGLADEVFTDVIDGIRKFVAHGYEPIKGEKIPAERAGGLERLLVTKWTSLYLSIVNGQEQD